jgi:hypothetical protein
MRDGYRFTIKQLLGDNRGGVAGAWGSTLGVTAVALLKWAAALFWCCCFSGHGKFLSWTAI